MRLIDGDAHVQKLRSTYINEIFPDWDLMDKKDQNIILKLMKGYKDIVYSIPAVDAVPVVHAYWIEYETMSWRHESPKRRKYYRCSNCRTASAVRHKACPNCFARMDADTQEREEKK